MKHGNLEMAEMVAKAGVDVNAKSVSDDRCFIGFFCVGLSGRYLCMHNLQRHGDRYMYIYICLKVCENGILK